MTRVRKMDIEELEKDSNVKKMMATLAQLENLDYLTLRGYRFRIMPCLDEIGILQGLTRLKLIGLLPKLPDANTFPQNISNLTLFNTCLDEDPMPVLEKLPKLDYLNLWNAFTGRKMVISRGGFPELKLLWIGETWHLRDLEVEEGSMPKLKVLEISHCPYLKKLPKEMVTIVTELKMLTTKRIVTEVEDELKPILKLIRHVDIQPLAQMLNTLCFYLLPFRSTV